MEREVKIIVDDEVWRQFSAIAAKRGEFKKDLMDKVLREFIEKERADK